MSPGLALALMVTLLGLFIVVAAVLVDRAERGDE